MGDSRVFNLTVRSVIGLPEDLPAFSLIADDLVQYDY